MKYTLEWVQMSLAVLTKTVYLWLSNIKINIMKLNQLIKKKQKKNIVSKFSFKENTSKYIYIFLNGAVILN